MSYIKLPSIKASFVKNKSEFKAYLLERFVSSSSVQGVKVSRLHIALIEPCKGLELNKGQALDMTSVNK